MPTKAVLESKTFWINLLVLIASIVLAVGANWGDLEQGASISGIVLSIANLILRLFTNQPVSFNPRKMG